MGKPEAAKKLEKVELEHCHVKACKTKVVRLGFCEEHFEQYKFGLIRKDGSPAADYEKKLMQYQAFKTREKLKKVA